MLFGLDGVEISILIVFVSLILGIMSGFPVAFALGGSALVSLTIIMALNSQGMLLTESGDPVIRDTWSGILRNVGLIPNRIFGNILGGPSVDVLLAVPLFVFMGITLERSRIAEDLLLTMARVFGPMPGGLAISVVVVGALLAASTGIVGATVVTMGLLSLPTMLKNRYSPELATGVICASGTLGQIIPPSIVLVLLGQQVGEIYSEAHPGEVVSVGTLFKAAIVPGIMLVGLYIAYILIFAFMKPDKAPPVHNEGYKNPSVEAHGSAGKYLFHLFVWPLAAIFLWVVLATTPDLPISALTAGVVGLVGLVLGLSFAMFPAQDKMPKIITLVATLVFVAIDWFMISNNMTPGVAFLYYLVPLAVMGWAIRAPIRELGQNDVVRVVFPPVVLIVAVLGSILGGLTNPTAAAGLGAGGAIMLAATRIGGEKYNTKPIIWGGFAFVIMVLLSGNFDLRMQVDDISTENWIAIITASAAYYVGAAALLYSCWILFRTNDVLKEVSFETTKITSMVFVILIGSQLLNLVLKTFGGDTYIQDFLQQFDSEYQVLLLVLAVIFVMGFVLDFLEIIYIVIPIVGPVIYGGDMDPKWVTILIAVNLQTSFLTPPFGFALFYLRGVAPKTVTTPMIYRGVLPFVLIQVLALVILWYAEPLTTFLPDLLAE